MVILRSRSAFNGMKLLTKIFIIIISAGVISIMSLFVLTYFSIRPVLTDAAGENLLFLTKETVNKIDRLLYDRYLDVSIIAQEEIFANHLAYGGDDRNRLNKKLEEMTLSSGPWDALLAVNRKGEIKISSFSVLDKINSKNIKDYPENLVAFEKAISGQPYYSDVLKTGYSGKPTIIFAAPVYARNEPGRLIAGAIIGNFAWGAVKDILNDLPGHAELYNREGYLVACNQSEDDSEILSKQFQSPELLDKILSSGHNLKIADDDVYPNAKILEASVLQSGFLSFKGLNWFLSYGLPTEKILAPSNRTALKLSLLILPIMLGIFGTILFFGYFFVIRPVRRLTETTRAITAGNLKTRARVHGHDEINELAHSFNEMVDKLESLDEAKTDFISTASHQLRTPLSTTNWSAEMLLGNQLGRLNERQVEYLKRIYRNNQRMIKLVGDLLNVSRIELGKLALTLKPVNLVSIIKSVLDELDESIKRQNLKLRKKYSSGHLIIESDPDILRIIVVNLLSNAVKYNQPGGEIQIKIEPTDGRILFEVSDTGQGIAKSDREKIWTKFFRAKEALARETDGTGLGLYITKGMVERLGGRIWFESKKGKGSTFFVELPVNNKYHE